MKRSPLDDVRIALASLRAQTGIPKGDPFDHILRTIDALAVAMAALSSHAEHAVETGQRQVGAIVSAAMTRQALWRLALPSAAIGGGIAVVAAVGMTIFVTHQADAQRSADRGALMAEFERLGTERAAFLAEIAQERRAIEKERAQIEAALPAELLRRADGLTGAARGLVQMEAASPGFIPWVIANGRTAMTLWNANGGNLCQHVVYVGDTKVCQFPAPSP